MNHLDSTPKHAKYICKFDDIGNPLISSAFDSVWQRLDCAALKAEYAKMGIERHLELEADINSAAINHIDAAVWLGWQAAKDPAAWLLDEDGEITDASMSELFSQRMAALGLGHEDIFGLRGALGDVICHLFTDIEAFAFALGIELQRDPEKLIFMQPRER